MIKIIILLMESVCAFKVSMIVLNLVIYVLMVPDVNSCRISFSPVVSSVALVLEDGIGTGLLGRLGNSHLEFTFNTGACFAFDPLENFTAAGQFL